MNNRIWRISELIKLVAVEDIGAICFVANQLRKHYNTSSIDELDVVDNNVIYDCYCRYSADNISGDEEVMG